MGKYGWLASGARWFQRLSDRKVVFSWDRGMDVPAENRLAHEIVYLLAAGLAEHVNRAMILP